MKRLWIRYRSKKKPYTVPWAWGVWEFPDDCHDQDAARLFRMETLPGLLAKVGAGGVPSSDIEIEVIAPPKQVMDDEISGLDSEIAVLSELRAWIAAGLGSAEDQTLVTPCVFFPACGCIRSGEHAGCKKPFDSGESW